jgi:hypothetical protein
LADAEADEVAPVVCVMCVTDGCEDTARMIPRVRPSAIGTASGAATRAARERRRLRPRPP